MALAPLYLAPRGKAFDPKVATVGFPLEICAIALLQYAAVAEEVSGPDSAHAWASRVFAWLLLVASTLAAAAILAHYAAAFARSWLPPMGPPPSTITVAVDASEPAPDTAYNRA